MRKVLPDVRDLESKHRTIMNASVMIGEADVFLPISIQSASLQISGSFPFCLSISWYDAWEVRYNTMKTYVR